MKVPAMSMSHPLVGRVKSGEAIASLSSDVECQAVVQSKSVYFAHRDASQNYRPYLRIMGDLHSLVPKSHVGQIGELNFPDSTGMTIDAFYEFTDEQLATLVSRGYFTGKMGIPEIMNDTEYELPVKANILVFDPETEDDVPVAFVGIPEQGNVEITAANSGYDFVEYFESVLETESELGDDEPTAPTREMDDIFAGQELDVEPELETEAEVEQTEPESKVDEALEAVNETEVAVEPEVLSREEKYSKFVKSYVDSRMNPPEEGFTTVEEVVEAVEEIRSDEPETSVPEGVVDLDAFTPADDDEPSVPPVSTTDPVVGEEDSAKESNTELGG